MTSLGEVFDTLLARSCADSFYEIPASIAYLSNSNLSFMSSVVFEMNPISDMSFMSSADVVNMHSITGKFSSIEQKYMIDHD